MISKNTVFPSTEKIPDEHYRRGILPDMKVYFILWKLRGRYPPGTMKPGTMCNNGKKFIENSYIPPFFFLKPDKLKQRFNLDPRA
jgi:hypothetical protein